MHSSRAAKTCMQRQKRRILQTFLGTHLDSATCVWKPLGSTASTRTLAETAHTTAAVAVQQKHHLSQAPPCSALARLCVEDPPFDAVHTVYQHDDVVMTPTAAAALDHGLECLHALRGANARTATACITRCRQEHPVGVQSRHTKSNPGTPQTLVDQTRSGPRSRQPT